MQGRCGRDELVMEQKRLEARDELLKHARGALMVQKMSKEKRGALTKEQKDRFFKQFRQEALQATCLKAAQEEEKAVCFLEAEVASVLGRAARKALEPAVFVRGPSVAQQEWLRRRFGVRRKMLLQHDHRPKN